MNDFRDSASLIRRIEQGDQSAVVQLCTLFKPMIISCARRFQIDSHTISREDLEQAGFLGLILAARKYASNAGAALSTYAFPWIMGEMRRTLRNAVESYGCYEKRRLVLQKQEQLCVQFGRQPTIAEIARALSIREDEVVILINLCGSSCDQAYDTQHKPPVLLDDAQNIEDRTILHLAIESLPDEQRKLIFLRYCRDLTQTETARLLGISQSCISKLESRALAALKAALS